MHGQELVKDLHLAKNFIFYQTIQKMLELLYSCENKF